MKGCLKNSRKEDSRKEDSRKKRMNVSCEGR